VKSDCLEPKRRIAVFCVIEREGRSTTLQRDLLQKGGPRVLAQTKTMPGGKGLNEARSDGPDKRNLYGRHPFGKKTVKGVGPEKSEEEPIEEMVSNIRKLRQRSRKRKSIIRGNRSQKLGR